MINAQNNDFQESIYFESAKHELTNESKTVLDKLADSLMTIRAYTIFIKGNTDNIGDSIINKKLSEQRALMTQQYLISKGISASVFSTSALGEANPIGDNSTKEGKQKNRRVDISVYYPKERQADNYTESQANNQVESAKKIPSIFELYRQTERKPQEFSINPMRDTFIRCEKGTLIYVKANSFKNSISCNNGLITLKVKETFLKSEMILDNLSTTSNGKIIETQGMVYTEANDCNGKKLNLTKGKDLVIMIPTDSIVQNARIFQGNRTPHDSIMNWTVNNNSVLSNFSLAELNLCNAIRCGGVFKCPFFFCQIKSFFQRLFPSKKRNRQSIVRVSRSMISKCESLEKLYKDYGVSNFDDLVNAINKPLLDSFRVNNIRELEDTLGKINRKKVELSYQNKSLNYEDFKFYIFNSTRLGWANVDVFVDLKPSQMVTMKINLKVAQNIDCKLVFQDRRFVIPATKTDKKYEFGKIPKGAKVWVVAIKYDEGKPYLSMEETTTDRKIVDVEFKSLTLDELKEKLKLLDE